MSKQAQHQRAEQIEEVVSDNNKDRLLFSIGKDTTVLEVFRIMQICKAVLSYKEMNVEAQMLGDYINLISRHNGITEYFKQKNYDWESLSVIEDWPWEFRK